MSRRSGGVMRMVETCAVTARTLIGGRTEIPSPCWTSSARYCTFCASQTVRLASPAAPQATSIWACNAESARQSTKSRRATLDRQVRCWPAGPAGRRAGQPGPGSSWPISTRVSVAGSVGRVDEGDVQLGVGGCAGEYRCGVVTEPDGDIGVGAPQVGQQGRRSITARVWIASTRSWPRRTPRIPATASRPSSAAVSARRAAGSSARPA